MGEKATLTTRALCRARLLPRAPAAAPRPIRARGAGAALGRCCCSDTSPCRGWSLSQNQWELPTLVPHSLSSAADCLEMSGFWSGRLNFKHFPEAEFVPESLGCLGVFLLLSLSSLFSLFLSLIFSRGRHIHHQVLVQEGQSLFQRTIR